MYSKIKACINSNKIKGNSSLILDIKEKVPEDFI
jgi:hypothetical protein